MPASWQLRDLQDRQPAYAAKETIHFSPVGIGDGKKRTMQPRVIRESRARTLMYLGFSLGFVFLSLEAHPTRLILRALMPIGTVFFGVGACLLVWLLLRPMRILLDREGFTLSGGLIRHPRKVLWAATECFMLVRLARGATYIGYNLVRPSDERYFPADGDDRAADAGIAGVWEYSNVQMVDELNRYRAEALRSMPDSPFRGFGRRGQMPKLTA